MSEGPPCGGRLVVCVGWFLHTFGSSFPITLGQVHLTIKAPHGSPYYESLLQQWFSTRRESVIRLEFSFLTLPQLESRAPPLGWRKQPYLNHRICIISASNRLLSSDLNDMAHHSLSRKLHAQMDTSGYGHTPTAISFCRAAILPQDLSGGSRWSPHSLPGVLILTCCSLNLTTTWFDSQ